MTKRVVVRVAAVLALTLGVLGALEWWTRPRAIEAGSAVVLVEGRTVGRGAENSVGVGVEGTLTLVGDRCVGLGDSVVVWPRGTSVGGEGESLTVTSGGDTVRIGDEVDAGTSPGLDLSEFEALLPEECADAELMNLKLEQ